MAEIVRAFAGAALGGLAGFWLLGRFGALAGALGLTAGVLLGAAYAIGGKPT
jgi:hypothetical protein